MIAPTGAQRRDCTTVHSNHPSARTACRQTGTDDSTLSGRGPRTLPELAVSVHQAGTTGLESGRALHRKTGAAATR